VADGGGSSLTRSCDGGNVGDPTGERRLRRARVAGEKPQEDALDWASEFE
jgi:hypothetical protein